MLMGCCAYAQPYPGKIQRLTVEDGLSSNIVYAIHQDSKGFLWFGTHDGLNRYDGYSFRKYLHDPLDSNSIPDNNINAICEDAKGNLWIATRGGTCRYDQNTGIFSRVEFQEAISQGALDIISLNQNEIMVDMSN